MNRLSAATELLRKAYFLARPYGRKKLFIVFLWVLAQGIVQVIGVTSIFPFLAVAADQDRIRESQFGKWVLPLLPPMDNHRLLVVAGLLAITLLFLSNAINLMSEVARNHYGHQFGHWLRIRLLRKIASQPYTFFLHQNSSVLLKKIASDVISYVQGVLLPLLDTIARLLTAVLLLLLVCLVNPIIAMSAALGLGAFYLVTFLYLNRKMRAVSAGLNDSNHGIWHEASQLLSGIKPIKIHQAEELFINRFSVYSGEQAHLMTWLPLFSNGPRYLIEPLAFGGLVAIILVLAIQGRGFAELLPILGVIALASYRLIPTLQLLYGQAAQVKTMAHHLDEIYEEFVKTEKRTTNDCEINLKPFPLHWSHYITLENLAFTYPASNKPILEDVSLKILKNSSVGFVGRTGCGKSTLLDLILGLHHPTSGRILVDGKELTMDQLPSWMAGIGYVPQDIFLLDDTVEANIALGIPLHEIDRERIKEVCEISQIQNLIEFDLSDGLQTMVGERGVRLSGGQRQRIGLARALYNRPQLLVLDEATSALDQSTEADLVKALDSIRGSLTVLIVAHRPETIQNCDMIHVIDSGRVLDQQIQVHK